MAESPRIVESRAKEMDKARKLRRSFVFMDGLPLSMMYSHQVFLSHGDVEQEILMGWG